MNLLLLPTEDLFHIFHFMNIYDLLKFFLVSKNIKKLVISYFAIFKKISDPIQNISIIGLKKLLSFFPEVKSIHLDDLSIEYIDYKIFFTLKKLEELTLSNIKNKIKYGFLCLNTLKKLTIDNCQKIYFDCLPDNLELVTIKNCVLEKYDIINIKNKNTIIIQNCTITDKYITNSIIPNNIKFIDCIYQNTNRSFFSPFYDMINSLTNNIISSNNIISGRNLNNVNNDFPGININTANNISNYITNSNNRNISGNAILNNNYSNIYGNVTLNGVNIANTIDTSLDISDYYYGMVLREQNII